jgi:hypothetical protein
MKNVYERVGIQVSHQLLFRMSEKVSTPARIKVWDKVCDSICGQISIKFYVNVVENVDL